MSIREEDAVQSNVPSGSLVRYEESSLLMTALSDAARQVHKGEKLLSFVSWFINENGTVPNGRQIGDALFEGSDSARKRGNELWIRVVVRAAEIAASRGLLGD